jgi:hypothetical protein
MPHRSAGPQPVRERARNIGASPLAGAVLRTRIVRADLRTPLRDAILTATVEQLLNHVRVQTQGGETVAEVLDDVGM